MVFEGKSCVHEEGEIEQLEQGQESQHVVLRQDLVKKRSSSSMSICELNSDCPRRHHAFFEEPLSSSLLLLDSISLKVKYFEEKAKLRQKLIMGFNDESDDREEEEEEEIQDNRPYAGTNVNLATNSASVDEGFGQEARDRERDWKEDASSSSPVVFNKGIIHHHTSALSAASSHESDNEQRHMQRINQKSQFNNSHSIQHHTSSLPVTSSHENKSEREYPMQRYRQRRRVDSNYSRRYSHSSNYTSCEEYRHSTTHFIGRRTDKYDEEWQPRTFTRKQPSHRYDSTTPVTPPQHTIHDGQLRNGSFPICEEPEPNQYHMDRSYGTKHHHRAQNETHTDRRYRTHEKGPMLITATATAPCRKKRFTFDERIEALRSYKRAHGNLHVPMDKCSPTGTLGIWLLKACRDLKRIELGKEPTYVNNVSHSHYWKWEVLKSMLVMDAEQHRGKATAMAFFLL